MAWLYDNPPPKKHPGCGHKITDYRRNYDPNLGATYFCDSCRKKHAKRRENQMTTKRSYIEQGWNGKGERVYLVLTDWTDETGRKRYRTQRFDTLDQAQNWLKWACNEPQGLGDGP